MIKRELYMKRIRPFMDNELIKILTGMRRCGKSVMLELIKAELKAKGVINSQIISINFEVLDNAYLCNAQDLHKYISENIEKIDGKAYLFFDEIQEVKDWEKCINSLRVKYDCDIYITGSNAKILSGELATYLAGRYVEFIIYPFSFGEFMTMYTKVNKGISRAEGFKYYVEFGGMPFLLNLAFAEEPSRQYLQDIYNSVILKDVVKRNNIRDVDLLERLIIYVLANIGHPFSAASITKYFKNENRKIAPETVLNYLKACEDAFLFYRVNRQDLVGKKILSINEKFYIADHGLREALYGKNNRDINQVLENIVALELLRRGYEITVGKINELEVNFVCEKKGEIIYIQVSYLLASERTIDREFAALQAIADNYPKYVLSMDEFSLGRNGIKHLNIVDFLLGNEI